MDRTLISFDDTDWAVSALLDPERWNGFACAWMTEAELLQFVKLAAAEFADDCEGWSIELKVTAAGYELGTGYRSEGLEFGQLESREILGVKRFYVSSGLALQDYERPLGAGKLVYRWNDSAGCYL